MDGCVHGGMGEEGEGGEEAVWVRGRPGPSTHPGSRKLISLSLSCSQTQQVVAATPLGHILGSAEKPGWSPPSPCAPVPKPSLDIVSGRLEAQVGFCEEGTSERGPRGKSWQRSPIASDHGP